MNRLMTLFAVAALVANIQAADPKNLRYEDIVSRLYDMKYLATKPQLGEKSGMFSSYDRTSKYNEQTGLYENWFSNNDDGSTISPDGVIVDLQGPGVVWRIWSAQPLGGGKWNVYVDGEAEPTISKHLVDFFNLNPASPPEIRAVPELSYMKARGCNTYIPIVFQKSLKIQVEPKWGRYFHVNYTLFPKGTTVPSTTGVVAEEQITALKKANDVWAKRGPNLFVGENAQSKEVTVELVPGEEKTVVSYDAPAAISSFVMKRPEWDREASVRILRELAVSMTWDDDQSPSVWSPLGDFFGTGAGENLHRTIASGMTKEGYYSNWYMPFKKAVIKLKNEGTEPRTLSFVVHTEALKENADDLLRYHYKWHRDDFSGFDEARLWTDRWPDWPVLKVDGAEGRFCGFTAHMWNPLHAWNFKTSELGVKSFPERLKEGTPNHVFFAKKVIPNKYWWGEGDEKFFVDGEKMPSTFGTGTEDYFGYAWGEAAAFDSALHAMPRSGAADEIGKSANKEGPGNTSHITMARWQIPDNVPFTQSFEAVVEKYHGNNWPLLNAYGVSWYQTAGKADYYKVVPVKDRVDYYVPAKYKDPVPVANGRLEGEHLSHIDVLPGTIGPTRPQDMKKSGDGWSNNAERRWQVQVPQHRYPLFLQFEVKEAVSKFSVGATYGPENGIYEFYLDEQKIGGPFDFYAPEYHREKDQVFQVPLKPGIHVLKVVAVGWNPEVEKLKKGLNFGLDYIQLGDPEKSF